MDVQKTILRSYQLAGLMGVEQGIGGPTWPNKFSFGRDMLQTIIDQLGSEGVFARAISLELVTMIPGTYIYTLPSTVFDLVEDGSYIDPTQDIAAATGETPVKQMDREAWQRMSTKAAESRPMMFWTKRDTFPVQAYVWPTPSEAGTIRFQCHRLLADVSPGTVTVDLERFWTSYLVWELAFHLASASSQDAGTCSMLASKAADAKSRAKLASNQSPPNRFYMTHTTSWTR